MLKLTLKRVFLYYNDIKYITPKLGIISYNITKYVRVYFLDLYVPWVILNVGDTLNTILGYTVFNWIHFFYYCIFGAGCFRKIKLLTNLIERIIDALLTSKCKFLTLNLTSARHKSLAMLWSFNDTTLFACWSRPAESRKLCFWHDSRKL